MEGPYLSPDDGPRGAHPREHITVAAIGDFQRRHEAAAGRIALVTLAPEVPGALRLIEYLVASGIRVAIGHSAASPRQIADAVSAGATLATHLGNGCAQILPRHPNVIWELLAADTVLASLIVDGHHLPSSTVKAMVRAKGADRSILVTDAVAAAGCPPGKYTIGGVVCELGANGRVSLPGTPYLAGSGLTLDRAIVNAVRFTGLGLHDVVAMASDIPARYIGASTLGVLAADWDASSRELHVLGVRNGGE
jgi:N-acetylglucosamine-6-phosphate deacetylase